MRFKVSVSGVALAAFVASCASPVPRFPAVDSPEAACVDGDMPAIGQRGITNQSTVYVLGFDGVKTSGSGPYCVLPGAHSLLILAKSREQVGREILDLELGPSRSYLIKARSRPDHFEVRVLDTSSALHTEIRVIDVPLWDGSPDERLARRWQEAATRASAATQKDTGARKSP
ncbi:MAG: hypothetical protein R3E87_13940 [Burkholderiaceae bacterium]